MTKSLNKIAKRIVWTAEMDALMQARYPNIKSSVVAAELGVNVNAVYTRASALGLKKTEEFMASPDSCRLRRGDEVGKAFRFQKGQVPPNKGVKGVVYQGCVATQFKPGQRSANYKPVGSTRICSKDGYVLIKMAEGLFQWKLLHRIVWERMNGPIPKGFLVSFIDRNPLNWKITNLTLITKKQNALRNSIHNYGTEIAQLYQLKGAITRQINKQKRASHE